MTNSSSRTKELEKFQKVIEVDLRDVTYLDQALTHSSYARSHDHKKITDNERMEFLGDAVLELIIADYLFRKYPYLDEGDLSKMRSAIVSEENLAYHANKINLGHYLLVGKNQEEIRSQDALLADAFEAVIGAIYLDRGLRVTRKFVLRFFIEKERHVTTRVKDFKSLLQEYTQSIHKKLPRYQVVQEKGPDHKKLFQVKVKVMGNTVGEAWGPSKKKAEKIAAERAWKRIKNESSGN